MTNPTLRSRPLNLWLALALPLSIAALMLLFEPIRLDQYLEGLAYDPVGGFIGRHSWILENALHDRAKQMIILLGVVSVGLWIAGLVHRPWRHLCRPFGYLALTITIASSILAPLKFYTAVQCPWDLTLYGGKETYSSLLSPRPATAHPGHCWPGGHAASGFVLFSLYFALRDRRPKLARYAFWLAIGLGTVLSVGRMLQGAHFLSHNVWSALIDWLVCLGMYYVLLYLPSRVEVTEPQNTPMLETP